MSDDPSIFTPSQLVPPEAPLAMPAQDFGSQFHDTSAPASDEGDQPGVALWRILAFSPAMAATVALAWVMQGWFAADGTTLLEWVLLTLIA